MQKGRLLEQGSVWEDGVLVERLFEWVGEVRSSKLAAGIRSRCFRLRRMVGDDDVAGVDVERDDLMALVLASRHWLLARDEWAAFRHTEYFSWKAEATSCSYQPPGKESKFTEICRHPPDPVSDGQDSERPLDEAITIAPGAALVGVLYRIGERVGPRDGSLIGHVYGVGSRVRLVATRHFAHIEAGDGKLKVAADEVPFLEQLALVGGA